MRANCATSATSRASLTDPRSASRSDSHSVRTVMQSTSEQTALRVCGERFGFGLGGGLIYWGHTDRRANEGGVQGCLGWSMRD